MNVLRWCPFVHLFNNPFQNAPYGPAYADEDIGRFSNLH